MFKERMRRRMRRDKKTWTLEVSGRLLRFLHHQQGMGGRGKAVGFMVAGRNVVRLVRESPSTMADKSIPSTLHPKPEVLES